MMRICRGHDLRPDFGIKLVSWFEHSATQKSCIVIIWVILNRIDLKRYALINHLLFKLLFSLKENLRMQ